MKKYLLRFKSIFHIPYVKSDYDYIQLYPIKKSDLFSEIKFSCDKNEISFLYKNKIKLYGRLSPSSDLTVLRQVIIENEYAITVDFYKDRGGENEFLKIIDAGANVGFTALYFKENFPNATIACIEPDRNNTNILKKNIALFIQNGTAIVYENALMGVPDKNITLLNNFRDGRDWSISVEESRVETDLKSITIIEIMQANQWDEIDILKIDIEGAERFIFQENNDLSFLKKIKVLTIEIHDEYNIRKHIYIILKKYDFEILSIGETTFCVNKIFFTI